MSDTSSILIVDDNPVNRDLMTCVVEDAGYLPLTATGGEDALARARDARPCLLITDVLMGGMNGFELARRLRDDDQLADLPVLFWTAHYDDAEVRELAAALDVAGVLPKPCDTAVVRATIDDVIGAAASATPPEGFPEFNHQHVRILSDKLVEKANELERTREELRDSENRFSMLVSNIPGAVYRRAMDADMTLELVSDRIEELTGFAAHRLIASDERTYASIVHPEDRERIAAEVLAAVSDGRHYGLAYRVIREDGTVAWVGDRGQAVGGEDGGPVWLYGTLSDIDARKRLEADHSRMEIELRMSQKLEAVGQLAAGIAHEINTPIQFVGDGVEFLEGAFQDLDRLLAVYRDVFEGVLSEPAGAELRARLEEAERDADLEYLQERVPASCERTLEGVERVASIVRAMKEFAHPHTEQAPADLNRALSTTLTVARNEYKYVAEVETDFGELPFVVCNLSDLNQVFLNLIVNAAHAIEDSADATGTLGAIRIRTAIDGDEALVSVTDTGHGIPEEIQTRIFDPFFTTKPVGRGSGQGLAIARTVVERHGGALDFTTSAGKGTTFTMRLPIAGIKGARA